MLKLIIFVLVVKHCNGDIDSGPARRTVTTNFVDLTKFAKDSCQAQFYNYEEKVSDFGRVPGVDSEIAYDWTGCSTCPFNKFEDSEDEVLQGKLGDCWLLTVIARLAHGANGFGTKITTVKTNQPHPTAFGFILYPEGRPTCVVVNRNIPYVDTKDAVKLKKPEPLYAYSPGDSDKVQQLPALLEKSVGKLYGGYGSLNSGLITEGYFLLTGGTCRIYVLCGRNAESNANFCFSSLIDMVDSIKNANSAGSILFGNKKLDPSNITKYHDENGLILGHTYAIMGVFLGESASYITVYETNHKHKFKSDSAGARFPKSKHSFVTTIQNFVIKMDEIYVCEAVKENPWDEIVTESLPTSIESSGSNVAFKFKVNIQGVFQLLLLQRSTRRLPVNKKEYDMFKRRYPFVLAIFQKMGKANYKFVTSTYFADFFYNIIKDEFEPGNYLAVPFALSQMTEAFSSYYGTIYQNYLPEYSLLGKGYKEKLKFNRKPLSNRYWPFFIKYVINTQPEKKSICATDKRDANGGCTEGHLQLYVKKALGLWLYVLHNPTSLDLKINFKLDAFGARGRNINNNKYVTTTFWRETNDVEDQIGPNRIYIVNFIWDRKGYIAKVDASITSRKEKSAVPTDSPKNFQTFDASSYATPMYTEYIPNSAEAERTPENAQNNGQQVCVGVNCVTQ